MRAKQIFSWVPIPAQVKLVYARLTLDRLTTLYFVLAVVYCVLQVILQLAAHSINVNAQHLITHILQEAKLTMDKFALLENQQRSPQARGADLTLTLCRGIPGKFGLGGVNVCDVLWSQDRGLVNDTVDKYISPSSESNKESDSSDSEDDQKTSALPVQAPATSVSTSSSSTPAFTTASSSSSSAIQPSNIKTRMLSSTSTSLAIPTPTGVANLIQPQPGSESSDSDDSDDEKELVPARLARRKVFKRRLAATEDGATEKVFDRQKLRPLSLSPRSQPRNPRSPSDIDRSHPDLETHIRRAHARRTHATSALLKRKPEGLNIEYVPIAPQTIDPKRFVSHSKRTRHLKTRSLFESDKQNITIKAQWKPKDDSDDEKEHDSNPMSMNSVPDKPILASIRISGLVNSGTNGAQVLAKNNTATFDDVELSAGCVLALSWPKQVLRDFGREDLAIMGFQVWLLGMSIVAILNESVPHMVAGIFTQALSTGWSAFQMARSASFRAQYEEVIVRGACSGVNVLPDYFAHRTADEIPIIVLNAIFFIVMNVLRWKVCKVYGWQTFKRIGASRVMNRTYRLVLAFSIHLQCAVYFLVASSALWVDELINGSIACFAEHEDIYKGVFISTILLLLPWLILGWIGVRRENKHMMHAFLAISLLFITAWAAMFASDVYRWVFATWPFFAAISVTSFMVLVATTALAIACRLNFKKGLAQFLKSQQLLPGADFTDAIPEKVGFPEQRAGEELPTFSVAFGHGGVPQPPSQMFPTPPAAALSRSSSLSSNPPTGYSVNPYATNGSGFWGEGNLNRSASGRSKLSTDASFVPTNRAMEAPSADDDAPRYTPEDSYRSQPSTIRRELPQWEEVRRSQLPPAFDLQPPRISIQPRIQPQSDRSSTFSAVTTGSGSGQVDVLRDGQWQRVDARELHRASVVSGVTHTSGFSGASWAPGDDARPLPLRAAAPAPPVPAYRPQIPAPAAPRAFVGLPGKNIKPRTTPSGRVTQQFSPPKATGVLGGSTVPTGW